jgi:hypothetical protein
MARKKIGRPVSGRNDATAKIDATVLSRAKYIASYEGKTLAEWLSETLEPIVTRRMGQINVEISKRQTER